MPNHEINIGSPRGFIEQWNGSEPDTDSDEMVFLLQQHQHQGPDGVDEEQDDADGVGHAIGLPEGLPEATWCPDVLLKQVAPDCKADADADEVTPEGVRE